MAQVLDQVGDEPAEVVALLRQLLDEGERARRVAVDDEVAEPEERLLLDRAEQLQHRLHRDRSPVAAASWSSVEIASRYEPRAPRAIERQRRVRRVDPLAVGDAAEHLARAPGRRGRWKTNVWQRERTVGSTFEQVGRAEDEDEVGRRLLDQLQQRVPGGVRELVRLVEDVDLVAALDRLEHDAVADLADVVDAALRRGVHLDHVERGAGGDRDAGVAGAVGLGVGPCAQFSALARMRAIEVLPVPRGPAKR